MDIKAKSNTMGSPPAPPSPEKQLKDVASLYEKQFLREMVKQMRSTVNESQLMPSSFAEKYYREELDHQYVETWGDRGGIGLGKLIYEQLVSKYGAMMGIKVPDEKPSGPLPLSVKDQWTGTVEVKNKSIKFNRQAEGSEGNTPIESPWDGEWLGSYVLDNGMRVAEIRHDGVKSQIFGDFQSGSLKPGASIKAGTKIGLLKPGINSFYWRLSDNKL